ncbi:MAG: DJ-1/PfpI family protein [Bacteroidota bacterium]
MIKNIFFVIPPAVHLLDINGPAHIFYEALEYGVDVNLIYITITGEEEVKSSAGLFFSKLEHFSHYNLGKDDYIMIPGLEYEVLLNPMFRKKARPFFDWLVKQYRAGASLCSICTGAFLLAETGLLNGKKATTHWKYTKPFSERFPNIEFQRNRLFVEEEQLYTSAGVSSGIDLSLFLLEKFFGSKLAMDVAKEVVIYFRRSENDPQLSVFLQFRNHIDNRVHEIQDFITKNISKKFTNVQLAELISTSERNLNRIFKKATGITIGTYVDKLRLEQALQLLNDGHKVEFVARACSYQSTNQLRNLLNKYSE